jgi:hypothetical protein
VRYRVRITLAGYGEDEAAAERFLGGFVSTHPEVSPVVSQNTVANTMAVVYSLEADDPNDAAVRGRPIFVDGAEASGLDPVDLLELNVSLVGFETESAEADERELQPA